MGSGKSVSSTAMAYTEYMKREMLITAIDCVLKDKAWDETVKILGEKYRIGKVVAEGLIRLSLEIYQEEGEEAYRDHKVVYSNNHLTFPYKHFDPQYFLEHLEDEELEDCILLLDEAYIYLDARSTATKMNKLFTYFVAQTRKRHVDLYVCTHHFDVLDKRLRRAVDIRGSCRFNKGPLEDEIMALPNSTLRFFPCFRSISKSGTCHWLCSPPWSKITTASRTPKRVR